jgi:hypothetical protein
LLRFSYEMTPKSPLHGQGGDGDFRRGLCGPGQVQLGQQYLEFLLRLDVPRQYDGSSVGRWQRHVHHLNRAKLFQHRARRRSARHQFQSLPQADVQRVAEAGHQDVRFDPPHFLGIDRTPAPIAFQVFERFSHWHQWPVESPPFGGRPSNSFSSAGNAPLGVPTRSFTGGVLARICSSMASVGMPRSCFRSWERRNILAQDHTPAASDGKRVGLHSPRI